MRLTRALASIAAIISLIGEHIFGVVDDTVRIAGTSASDRRRTVLACFVGAHVERVLCCDSRDDTSQKTPTACGKHLELPGNMILKC